MRVEGLGASLPMTTIWVHTLDQIGPQWAREFFRSKCATQQQAYSLEYPLRNHAEGPVRTLLLPAKCEQVVEQARYPFTFVSLPITTRQIHQLHLDGGSIQRFLHPCATFFQKWISSLSASSGEYFVEMLATRRSFFSLSFSST